MIKRHKGTGCCGYNGQYYRGDGGCHEDESVECCEFAAHLFIILLNVGVVSLFNVSELWYCVVGCKGGMKNK